MIELLNDAEEALRRGDWTGFGDALERLRQHLTRAPATANDPG